MTEERITEQLWELDNRFGKRKNGMKRRKCRKVAKGGSSELSSSSRSSTSKRITIKIEDAQKIAKERLGECLSEEYIPGQKLIWKCNTGRTWPATYNHVKYGTWCPRCVRYTGEEIARRIFELLFDCEFNKIRPSWLQGLELDGYNDELKIAFEYDGKQHYKFVKRFHGTIEGLRMQQKRDRKI